MVTAAGSVEVAPPCADFRSFFRAELTSMVVLAHAVCRDGSAAEDIAAEAAEGTFVRLEEG